MGNDAKDKKPKVIKPLRELNLEDDFMFGKVMQNTDILCRVISMLLRMDIKSVEFMNSQQVFQNYYDNKGVRLDVYATDEKGTVYNVEVQSAPKDNLFKRSRYYQSTMDAALLPKGKRYTELRDSYVIFISTFDLFGKGRHIYTCSTICEEDTTIRVSDGTKRIFVNTKGTLENEVTDDVKLFLKYVEHSTTETIAETDSEFFRRLHEVVEAIRVDPKLEVEYMTTLTREQDIWEDGKIEGKIEKGIEDAVNIIKEFGAKPLKALRTVELPEDNLGDLIKLLTERGISYQN
ncbi:hypothetical protein AGMMS49975_29460 [Clostridia bacterium]|nr:hypothetical protein AGMMS49975_29460 [Clostridia bacterium]